MIIYQTLSVFSIIGLFAIAMPCCWKKVSASQFTLFMTIANIGRLAGAALIVPIKTAFGWEYAVITFSVLIALLQIPVILITQFQLYSRYVSNTPFSLLEETPL
jgi:PAT family beta-lactamase induction signal transducer AmpG